MDALIAVLSKNALVTALAVTGLMMFVSHLLSKYLTKGKLQSSAIAITLGLVVAYFASKGVPTIKKTDLIRPIAIDNAITSELAPMAVPVIGPTI